MLRIVICDDDPAYLSKIKACCANYFEQKAMCSPEILSFDNSLLCLEKLDQIGGCDIALLDICMPGISGIAAAREITARYPKTKVIFLTSSQEYAVDAFSVGAIHYLLKPFSQKDFSAGMDRVMTLLEATPIKWLYINAEGGAIHKIDVSTIIYIESFRNGRSIHTENGVFVETKVTLQGLLNELTRLSAGQFISPYRGYIINFEAVKSVTRDGIVLNNNVNIPIKPDSFRKLRDSYFAYEFGRREFAVWNI